MAASETRITEINLSSPDPLIAGHGRKHTTNTLPFYSFLRGTQKTLKENSNSYRLSIGRFHKTLGGKISESAMADNKDLNDPNLHTKRQSGTLREGIYGGLDCLQNDRASTRDERAIHHHYQRRDIGKDSVPSGGEGGKDTSVHIDLFFCDNPASTYVNRWLQPFSTVSIFVIICVVFLLHIPVVEAADQGEDMTNNLFSDLAPILALFGEQVTKQFMSESSGWADTVLFAMAPLGVITGIVSAIRVAGPTWLKALVGRGKEGFAQAELELMSSNSSDVGEMWNGQAIVRVLGKPSIFQFIYTQDTVAAAVTRGPTVSPGISTARPGLMAKIDLDVLRDNNAFFEREGAKSVTESSRVQGHRWEDHEWHQNVGIEMRPLLPITAYSGNVQESRNESDPPNISLNARGELIGDLERWSIAGVGIIAQVVVLIFGSIISYHPRLKPQFLKDGADPSSQAFPCTAFGTVCLSIGMITCSYVVDCASTEETWVLKKKTSNVNCKVAWVQSGGIVNDQEFSPYLIFGHEGQQEIRTSRRCNSGDQHKLQFWVLVGTSASIIGFVTQFIGLRGMHWSATVAQLAATAFVTILRSVARRRMSKEPTVLRAVAGYELDCMARKLNDCIRWKIAPEIPHTIPAEQRDNFPHSVMATRKRLDCLSGWSADIQDVSNAVCTSMEKTINYIFHSQAFKLPNSARESVEFRFSLAALALKEEPSPSSPSTNPCPPPDTSHHSPPPPSHHYGYLPFKLTRSGKWGQWRMSDDMRQGVSAALSLCKLHFVEEESYYNKGVIFPEGKDLDDLHRMAQVLPWPRHQVHRRLFRVWMGSHDIEIVNRDTCNIARDQAEPVPAPHHFIYTSGASGKDQHVAIQPNASVKKLFAQQIFSTFLSEVLTLIREIAGPAERIVDRGRLQGLRHTAISQLVDLVSETGLGNRQEILMVFVSHFGDHKLLPPPDDGQRARVEHLRIERTLGRSRLDNQWDYTASYTLNLLSDYWAPLTSPDIVLEYNFTSNPIPGDRGVMCMTQRFITRLASFLSSAEGDHTQALFLQWLRDIDLHILKSLPSPSRRGADPDAPSPILDKLIQEASQFLDPIAFEKATTLLEKFKSFERDFGLDRDRMEREASLLRRLIHIQDEMTVKEVFDQAIKESHTSVLEGLADRHSNLPYPERYLPAMTSPGHAQVVCHLLTQLFWFFPAEYRQFQMTQQPALLLNAVEEKNEAMFIELLKHTMVESRDEYLAAAFIASAWDNDSMMIQALLKAKVNLQGCRLGTYSHGWLLGRLTGDVGWKLYWKSEREKPKDSRGVKESREQGAQRRAPEDYTDPIDYFLAPGNSNMPLDAFSVWEPLQAAAGRGHLSIVEDLLSAGAPVNTEPTGRWWRSALQAAAAGGSSRVVETLIEAGADVNQPAYGIGGRTALQGAAEEGRLSMVERLLGFHADFDAIPAPMCGLTALQAAAEHGHLGIVDLLLQQGANVNEDPADNRGRTALQAATGRGHLEVVDRLLERGADVNAAAAKFGGRTALQAAAGGGHLKVVDRLIECGADINEAAAENGDRTGIHINMSIVATEWDGRTALQAAAGGGHLEVVIRLLEHKADANAVAARNGGRTALQAAAGSGHLEVVVQLLEHKADVNAAAAKNGGRTALQAAAGGGHLEVVNRLLEHKADVNARSGDYPYDTALEAAARSGYERIVSRLLEHKAIVNPGPDPGTTLKPNYIQTPLQAAAQGGSMAVVERLLKYNANVNAEAYCDGGRTALQEAAKGGYLAVVEKLLEHNADVNAAASQYKGLTALEAAASGGYLKIVERLLERGAIVNTGVPKDQSRRTALQAAAEGGYLAVVGRLLEKGANVNAETVTHGRTALQAAAGAGYLSLVDLLLEKGADVDTGPDAYAGGTALQAAAGAGHLAVVKRLLEYKADVNTGNSGIMQGCGVAALAAAQNGGYKRIAELLLSYGATEEAGARQRRTEAIERPTGERGKPSTIVDEEYTSFLIHYLKTEGRSLKTFYNDADLPKLGEKAKTMIGPLMELGFKQDTAQDLTLLILYDIVMLIDDSRSMKSEQGGQRIKTLHTAIDEITRVYDYANDNGIKSIKFLNAKKGIMGVRNRTCGRVLEMMTFNGSTRIGTALSKNVLDKCVWGVKMKRPLLVIIITDGDVEGEREGLLKDVIRDCVARLAKDEERGSQAVSFQFCSVGDDRGGQRLLKNLVDSKGLGDHIDYLPASSPPEMLRDPENKFLILPKLLLGAISTHWKENSHPVFINTEILTSMPAPDVDPPANPATKGVTTEEEYIEKPTTTAEECTEFFQDYIKQQRPSLKTFYTDDEITKLGQKAEIMFGSLIELGCGKEAAQQLTLLILYDIVMLIDDSRSMKSEEDGKRIETLHKAMDEITRVYDYANEDGIKSVRFLNAKKGVAKVKNGNWKKQFDKIVYNGITRIGTSLNHKVLDRFVWSETMTKPLLVMVITDGDVEGERDGLLADVIAECIQKLAKDEKRGKQAVSFHFSRVGDDDDAQKLLETLENNEEFGKHVDCLPATDALEGLQDETGRKRWTVLPKLLLGAISNF